MSQNRQQRIRATLQGNGGWMHGSELASVLGVSKRTIQEDIKAMNRASLVSDGRVCVESDRRSGYRLAATGAAERSSREGALPRPQPAQVEYLIERQMLALLLFETEYVSFEGIARCLYVSRSTIASHFPRIKRIMARTEGIRLVITAGKGVRIEASERMKRALLMRCASLDDDRLMLGVSLDEAESVDCDQLRHLIAELLIRYSVAATSGAFESFVQYLSFSIVRSRRGFLLEEVAEEYGDRLAGDDVIADQMAAEIAGMVHIHVGYVLSEAERREIAALFQELGLIYGDLPTEGTAEALLDAFNAEVAETLGFSLHLGPRLRHMLSCHIARLGKRLSSGRIHRGSETDKLFTLHPLAVHLLKTCLEPVLGMRIPDAELGYMVLYLATAIEEMRDQLQVLLVSDESAAKIFELEKRLSSYVDEGHGAIRAIPSYMYFAQADVYGAWAHVFITTSPMVALQDARFVLIGDEAGGDKRLERIRAEIMRRRADMDRRAEEKLVIRYPVAHLDEARLREALTAIDDDAGCDHGTTAREQGPVPSPSGLASEHARTRRSAEVIGKSLLCIIETGRSLSSSISACDVEEPLMRGGKRIDRVVLVSYGGDVGVVPFFKRVQSILASALD